VVLLEEAFGLAIASRERDRLSERVLAARAASDAAAHRWATIARFSGMLARTLDFDRTLEAILHGAVPYLGDWAMVDITQKDGAVHRSCHHHASEFLSATQALKQFPFADGPSSARIEALPDDGLLLHAPFAELTSASESEVAALDRLKPNSAVVVPLRFGDGTHGALTVVAGAASGQEYGPIDRDLLRQIGRQAGLAIATVSTFREAQRAKREREEVLAIVSHDLKNPLNVLRFSTTLLLMPEFGEAQKVQQIQAMERAVVQMDKLINNLLDASRIDAGRFSVEPAPLDAATVVQESIEQVRPLAEKAGIELVTDVLDPLPPILADRDRLLQAFGNLLGNAISFTSPQGIVGVRTETAEDFVAFEVRDTGSGIDPEALPHVFDRYWQARRRGHAGAGLGLTIVRGIVQAHGGEISVRSTSGVGTTFRFTIPISPAPADAGT
jgi:signal transduction histidine kinase